MLEKTPNLQFVELVARKFQGENKLQKNLIRPTWLTISRQSITRSVANVISVMMMPNRPEKVKKPVLDNLLFKNALISLVSG